MDGTQSADFISTYYCNKLVGKAPDHAGTNIHATIGPRNTPGLVRKLGVIVPEIPANTLTAQRAIDGPRAAAQPIYEALAVQDGIHLPKAETRHRHRERQVTRVMRSATESLSTELTVADALEQVRTSKFRTWLVTDEQGLVGVINFSTLASEIAKGADQQKLSGLMDGLVFPHVHPDQGLIWRLSAWAQISSKFCRW